MPSAPPIPAACGIGCSTPSPPSAAWWARRPRGGSRRPSGSCSGTCSSSSGPSRVADGVRSGHLRSRRRRPGAARGDQADAAGHAAPGPAGPGCPAVARGHRRGHHADGAGGGTGEVPALGRGSPGPVRGGRERGGPGARDPRGGHAKKHPRRGNSCWPGPGPEDLVAPYSPGAAHPGNAGRASRPGRVPGPGTPTRSRCWRWRHGTPAATSALAAGLS